MKSLDSGLVKEIVLEATTLRSREFVVTLPMPSMSADLIGIAQNMMDVMESTSMLPSLNRCLRA